MAAKSPVVVHQKALLLSSSGEEEVKEVFKRAQEANNFSFANHGKSAKKSLGSWKKENN